MALVTLPGSGLWIPAMPLIAGVTSTSDSATLDADEEEFQCIGHVNIDGSGTKTFGTNSKVDWLPGASITFASGSTLRVGVKKTSTVDTANGPVGRATIGQAGFDMYKDLVGGTDTITSTTWRSDTMVGGTPFSVTQGALIAICWHLDTSSGAPNVKMRSSTSGQLGVVTSLVTSGPTYAQLNLAPNCLLTFDDGTLGWLEPSYLYSVVDTSTSIGGSGTIFGNILQVPFACTIDALGATCSPGSNTADFSLVLYALPLGGTPTLVEAVSRDANVIPATSSNRYYWFPLSTPRTIAANTDYAIGVRQDTANSVTVVQRDVNAATHFKPQGLGALCYAATSAGGATFAAVNSGNRRYHIWMRVNAIDMGSGGGPVAGNLRGGFLN